MSRALRGAWALAGLLLGGCSIDLWVGEPAGTTGDGTTAASSDGGTTLAPPSSDASTGTTAHEPDPTTEAATTVALDDGTSSTGPVGEEGTSTGPVGEPGTMTTDAEIPCPGLGMLDCNELGDCLWYGSGEAGECAANPCENPRHECWALGVGDCEALFACAWVGSPEPGECAPIECVPCEILGADQCTETPTCVWSEGEAACLPA